MEILLKQLLPFAPILGAGLTFLLIAFAIASYLFKSWYHGRLEAIKRATPEDLPSIVGDEIDKLRLNAHGLSKKDTFELVKTALDQRESRSRRSFYAFLLISMLVFVLAVIGMLRSPSRPLEDTSPKQNPSPPSPTSSFEPMTGSIVLDSAIGDYIGDGKRQEFTDTNGIITGAGTLNSITIHFRGDDNWDLIFEAPEGKELSIGVYDLAQRAPFHNPVKPGLEISGAGRGCNELHGRFEILSLERNATEKLEKFEASFEQFCDTSRAPLKGKIKVNRVIESGWKH